MNIHSSCFPFSSAFLLSPALSSSLSLPTLLSSPHFASLVVCLSLFYLLYLFISRIPDPSSSILPGAWILPLVSVLGMCLPCSVLGMCGLGQREIPTDLILLKFICCKGYSGAETETHSTILCPLCISFPSSKLGGGVLTHHLHSDSKTLPSGLG